jgi:hypothetical protein
MANGTAARIAADFQACSWLSLTSPQPTLRFAASAVASTHMAVKLTLARTASSAVFLLACACSGPQVRSVGTGGGALAYELRGQDMAAIDAEAGRLCVKGYDVLRQSVSFSPTPPSDNDAAKWLQPVGDWLSGMPGNQAQATVICRA